VGNRPKPSQAGRRGRVVYIGGRFRYGSVLALVSCSGKVRVGGAEGLLVANSSRSKRKARQSSRVSDIRRGKRESEPLCMSGGLWA
jgi:hypothetical protein